MTTKAERLAMRKQVVGTMVVDLERGRRVHARVGGHLVETLGQEIAMHRTKLDDLTWAERATDEEIQARIDEIAAGLSPEALACKYGNVRGLTLEEVTAISRIENLEVVLGTHPGVK